MAIGGRQKEEGFWASTWDTIKTLVYAVLIAMVFRTVLIEPFSIPSGSMKPTLLEGDYLFVTKYSYGYSRFSMPFSPPLWEGRILYNPPKRGDVVVFRLPSDNKTDYIKRIIGLPGDRIQVTGGVLQINGEAVRRLQGTAWIEGMQRYDQYVETLPGGRRHSVLERSDNEAGDNTRVYVVPPDHFFAMGDNRDNSQDSRFPDVGPVPAENLIGRAEFVFFSHDGTASWWQAWKWPASIRWGRIFMSID
ncbi:MAG: signal peptidase I [Reyranellaceae bacterium]